MINPATISDVSGKEEIRLFAINHNALLLVLRKKELAENTPLFSARLNITIYSFPYSFITGRLKS
jgi:hypothetical protein